MLLLGACAPPAPGPAQTDAAAFHWFEYTGTDARFELPIGDGEFRNPVLAGFHPDPSIVRVGSDYYLVTSTFAWFPGVPVFHSTDLVNWARIGHALDRPSQLPLAGLGVSQGVFAPTIRHRDGIFYMVTTLVGGGGNFYVTATDPAGPWSEPAWLPEVDGIDPSIFFDDDGRAYITNNGLPEGEPRYEGHRAIWIQEFDPRAGVTTGPRRMIVDGGVDPSAEPIWIEGPHLFKVDGWYYLIAAEGGTEYDHSEVVFRSREVMGPYEPGPANPILTQRTLDPARPFPVTNTGHADFVETPDGEWWAVFLGVRPYEDRLFNTGRETFLHPVTWQGGWPMILDPSLPVPAVLPAPKLAAGTTAAPQSGNFTWRDDFDGGKLSLEWNSLRGPAGEWAGLETVAGTLLLVARDERLSGAATPSFLARRQQHASFTATASMRLPRDESVAAGIAAFQSEHYNFFLGVRRRGDSRVVFLERAAGDEPVLVAEEALPASAGPDVMLRIEGRGRPYSFSFGYEPGQWKELAEEDGAILHTGYPKGFVGAYIGLYARRD